MSRPFLVCHCGDHAFVALTRGFVALVDPADAPKLAAWDWAASNRLYARRNRDNAYLYMHRAITDAPAGRQVDHINGNGLDNRKANLRLCTAAENCANARPMTGKASRFKGVDWHSQAGKWRAKIKSDRRTRHIGLFRSEAEAATAYDQEARALFGQFAKLNFPD